MTDDQQQLIEEVQKVRRRIESTFAMLLWFCAPLLLGFAGRAWVLGDWFGKSLSVVVLLLAILLFRRMVFLNQDIDSLLSDLLNRRSERP